MKNEAEEEWCTGTPYDEVVTASPRRLRHRAPVSSSTVDFSLSLTTLWRQPAAPKQRGSIARSPLAVKHRTLDAPRAKPVEIEMLYQPSARLTWLLLSSAFGKHAASIEHNAHVFWTLDDLAPELGLAPESPLLDISASQRPSNFRQFPRSSVSPATPYTFPVTPSVPAPPSASRTVRLQNSNLLTPLGSHAHYTDSAFDDACNALSPGDATEIRTPTISPPPHGKSPSAGPSPPRRSLHAEHLARSSTQHDAGFPSVVLPKHSAASSARTSPKKSLQLRAENLARLSARRSSTDEPPTGSPQSVLACHSVVRRRLPAKVSWCTGPPAFKAGLLYFGDTRSFLMRATPVRQMPVDGSCRGEKVEHPDGAEEAVVYCIKEYAIGEERGVMQVITEVEDGRTQQVCLLRLFNLLDAGDAGGARVIAKHYYIPLPVRPMVPQEAGFGRAGHTVFVEKMLRYQWYELAAHAESVRGALRAFSKASAFAVAARKLRSRAIVIQRFWRRCLSFAHSRRQLQKAAILQQTALLLRSFLHEDDRLASSLTGTPPTQNGAPAPSFASNPRTVRFHSGKTLSPSSSAPLPGPPMSRPVHSSASFTLSAPPTSSSSRKQQLPTVQLHNDAQRKSSRRASKPVATGFLPAI
ncbi:hypothetical protein DIPPA_20094 [Diplonema papillatum]|nr:hypothetical protein DIPPA_20094 [Diplonema papillatum]|eukprot:gene22573-34548_t